MYPVFHPATSTLISRKKRGTRVRHESSFSRHMAKNDRLHSAKLHNRHPRENRAQSSAIERYSEIQGNKRADLRKPERMILIHTYKLLATDTCLVWSLWKRKKEEKKRNLPTKETGPGRQAINYHFHGDVTRRAARAQPRETPKSAK